MSENKPPSPPPRVLPKGTRWDCGIGSNDKGVLVQDAEWDNDADRWIGIGLRDDREGGERPARIKPEWVTWSSYYAAVRDPLPDGDRLYEGDCVCRLCGNAGAGVHFRGSGPHYIPGQPSEDRAWYCDAGRHGSAEDVDAEITRRKTLRRLPAADECPKCGSTDLCNYGDKCNACGITGKQIVLARIAARQSKLAPAGVSVDAAHRETADASPSGDALRGSTQPPAPGRDPYREHNEHHTRELSHSDGARRWYREQDERRAAMQRKHTQTLADFDRKGKPKHPWDAEDADELYSTL
jgi:hypothetical protein